MAIDKIADKVIETDVLVLGGGIGGLCAAAKARDRGLDVTLIEKAKCERSGCAAQGIDHFGPVASETLTPLEVVRATQKYASELNGDGRFWDPNILYRVADNGLWALGCLEELGLPVKWHWGEMYRVPYYVHDGLRALLRVHWQDIKPILATAARKRRVNVLDRTMIVDLLTNKGTVVGGTAVNTRTGEFIVIKAKATVIATGLFARCYDPETPLFYKYKFRFHWCPASISGDGWAAAYRAGAELANMDITGWHFRNRDDVTISFGKFGLNDGVPADYLTWTGEELVTKHTAKYYDELERAGKTPLYRSLERLPDDWHKRIEVSFVDEELLSFDLAEKKGFNTKTHRYEFMLNKLCNFRPHSGININEDFRATLKGLYAVGDCATSISGGSHASITGLLVGDNMRKFVNKAGEPVVDEGQVESQKQAALAPLNVKDGTEPMELECSIRHICDRYVGQFKSEGKLREGQRRLGSLRRVFLPKLMAKNPHYLMRCLEVRNIMDLAEAHIQACLERKETRGNHIRLDYPEKDPSRDNMITFQRIEEGKPVLEIREVPDFKPEYAKEGK